MLVCHHTFRPLFEASVDDISTKAAAPSLMPEALPAVTVPDPSLMKAGLNLPSPSAVQPDRGNSSFLTSMGPPLDGTITGTISSSKAPFFWAFSHLFWDWLAKLSCSFLVRFHCLATFSAGSKIHTEILISVKFRVFQGI